MRSLLVSTSALEPLKELHRLAIKHCSSPKVIRRWADLPDAVYKKFLYAPHLFIHQNLVCECHMSGNIFFSIDFVLHPLYCNDA